MITDLVHSLRAKLSALPKVELHRHLEGSLRLETLIEIARAYHLDLPSYDLETLRPYVQVMKGDSPDFIAYLEKFKLLRRFYVSPDLIARIVSECIADAATDNIKYLELRFNPVALSKLRGFALEQVVLWVAEAAEQAQRDYDIKVKLIVQIGRDESISTARHIAEIAVAAQHKGVVGLDLAGDELTYPATPFTGVFCWAKEKGLHITIHAGEVGPAANIREAVERIGAERIGHGIRAVEDPELMPFLAERGVTLEMCPTSNLHTGAIATLSEHPLPYYLEQDVRVTINTDDPGISNTSLTDEYVLAVQHMGIDFQTIRQTILYAAAASFLPESERHDLITWFKEALAPL
ncbi:MAG: adenosine deaminase [Anaerolineae bacterium]